MTLNIFNLEFIRCMDSFSNRFGKCGANIPSFFFFLLSILLLFLRSHYTFVDCAFLCPTRLLGSIHFSALQKIFFSDWIISIGSSSNAPILFPACSNLLLSSSGKFLFFNSRTSILFFYVLSFLSLYC